MQDIDGGGSVMDMVSDVREHRNVNRDNACNWIAASVSELWGEFIAVYIYGVRTGSKRVHRGEKFAP